MTSKVLSGRPSSSEHAPYYSKYIDKVEGDDALAAVEKQLDETLALFRRVPEAESTTAPEPGKWTLREVLGHVTDGERVFSYRALRFARADATDLPGFEQDDYVREANHNSVPVAELLAEFEAVRRSTIALFKTFRAETWQRSGTANGNRVSVRALGFIIAGHATHHCEIVREKYLKAGGAGA